MRINVTAEDIAEGRRGSCSFCPVALAIGRQCKGVGFAGSGTLAVRDEPGAVVRAHTPMPFAVYCFASEFDAGFSAKPFSFDLPDDFTPEPTP